jgi:hypothetical protein
MRLVMIHKSAKKMAKLPDGIVLGFLVVLSVLSVLGLTGFILSIVWHDTATVTSLNTLEGAITLAAGPGIDIVPTAITETLTIDNTGILSNVGGTCIAVSTLTGVSTISSSCTNAAGPGISLVTVGNQTTISNTGILSNVAGTCISVGTVAGVSTISDTCTSTEGAGIVLTTVGTETTISDYIVSQSGLPESSPLGPQVAYGITIAAIDNAWRVTTSGAFPGTFVPGVVAGDGGQGNVGGTAWTAPANGVYTFDAYCSVTPSAYVPNDYQSASIALSLGATTVDPTTGVIPGGGRSTLDLSVGSNGAAGPAVPSALSIRSTVHVCPTCLVNVGKSLHLHGRLDHAGISGPSQATTSAFGVLAGTTTTTVGTTNVVGNLGVAPGVAVTGPFNVSGATDINNAAAITAQTDLTALYNALNALVCTQILQGTDLTGLTLTPGVYCFTSSGAFSTGTLTLNGLGNPGAQFVFKFGTTLTTGASAVVAYTNGAQPCGTFWLVGSSATFGATQTFAGTVAALTTITVGAGVSTFAGGLLARNGAVTFAGANNITVTALTSCVAPLPVTGTMNCLMQVARTV